MAGEVDISKPGDWSEELVRAKFGDWVKWVEARDPVLGAYCRGKLNPFGQLVVSGKALAALRRMGAIGRVEK